MAVEKVYLMGCFIVLLLSAVLVAVDMFTHVRIEKEIAWCLEEAKVCENACKVHVNEMRKITWDIDAMIRNMEKGERKDDMETSTE